MFKSSNRFSPIIGISVFIITMLILIIIGGPIQGRYGMIGVAITEVMILLMGILPAIILKQDLREVFPFKTPKIREIFGTIMIWVGTFSIGLIGSMIIMYFFREGMMNVSTGLNEVISSVPFILTFLIVAVMPAICEEALHRGFILANFKPLNNKFAIVLSMAIIFGVFHLDFYRFLPTALLGAALSYVMIETNNMWMPMLFHFINNLLSSFASFFSNGTEASVELSKDMIAMSIGLYLIIGAITPFLLYYGAKFLKKERIQRRYFILTAAASIMMFILGILIFALQIINNIKI